MWPADRLAKSSAAMASGPPNPSSEGRGELFGYRKFGEDQTTPALRPLVTEDSDSI
jgi:hypothetical protein